MLRNTRMSVHWGCLLQTVRINLLWLNCKLKLAPVTGFCRTEFRESDAHCDLVPRLSTWTWVACGGLWRRRWSCWRRLLSSALLVWSSPCRQESRWPGLPTAASSGHAWWWVTFSSLQQGQLDLQMPLIPSPCFLEGARRKQDMACSHP